MSRLKGPQDSKTKASVAMGRAQGQVDKLYRLVVIAYGKDNVIQNWG